MDLRAPLELQAMIKSMTDVVLPALDPANQMAQEQAQLILGMMHLMAVRLPMEYHYGIDQLKRYLALAGELQETVTGGPLTNAALETLVQSSLSGTDCLTRPQVSPGDLEAAVLDLRTQISTLVEALWQDGEADCRAVAGKAVLAAAKEQILRQRAWFVPQGWDADTSAIPAIETLIDFPTPPGQTGA